DFMMSGLSKSEYSLEKFNEIIGGDMTAADQEKATKLSQEWFTATIAEQSAMVNGLEDINGSLVDTAALWTEASDLSLEMIKAIDRAILDIKYSSLNVGTTRIKKAEAAKDYGKLLAAARAGDETAIEDFISFAPQYLSLAQEDLKSSQAYQDLYSQTLGELEEIKDYVKPEYFYEKLMADELSKTSDSLSTIEESSGLSKDILQGIWDQLKTMEGQVLTGTTASMTSEVAGVSGLEDARADVQSRYSLELTQGLSDWLY
ncbi:unnamed protein product, partial [marine sediment metagenome]